MFTFEDVQKIRSMGSQEIHLFIDWLYGFNPCISCGLEIGVQSGSSLVCWQTLLEPDGMFIGIDINVCNPVYGWLGVMDKTIEKFKDDSRIHLLIADSRVPETLVKVKEILGSRFLDFLYIDGEHSEPGTRKDFEMYFPLVAEGGIIAFHDATRNTLIRPLIEEIADIYKFREQSKFSQACLFNSRVGQCGLYVLVKDTLKINE